MSTPDLTAAFSEDEHKIILHFTQIMGKALINAPWSHYGGGRPCKRLQLYAVDGNIRQEQPVVSFTCDPLNLTRVERIMSEILAS